MWLAVDAREEDGWTVVSVRGDLEAHTAQNLDFRLAHLNLQGANRMMVDLDAVELVDSAGLRALLMARNRCVDAGGQFLLANPPPIVLRMIEVTGLRGVLPVRG